MKKGLASAKNTKSNVKMFRAYKNANPQMACNKLRFSYL